MSNAIEPDDAQEPDEVIDPTALPDRVDGPSRFELSYHEGPLPTPEAFAAYIDAYPDAGREIIEIAKAAQAHQQRMGEGRLAAAVLVIKGGLVALNIAVAGVLVLAIALAVSGEPVWGVTIGLGDVLIAALLNARSLWDRKKAPDRAPS